MKKYIFIAICLSILISCAAQQPTQPREVVMTIGGNVSSITVETEHPCEGNWNFCDHVLDNEYSSYVFPEF